MVKKELEILDVDAEVYKLVGPVLVKQTKTEALGNVQKRLDYIEGEM
jgi:prefoldin beta subunit